jgi:hypothetical protein
METLTNINLANDGETPKEAAQTVAPLETVSALHMTLDEFVTTLRPSISSANHAHLFGIAKANARIAANVETRADELAALFAEVKAQGFTPADLVAIERHWRGVPIFGYNTPDYVLPVGYRRADLKQDDDAAPNAE